MFIVFLLKCHLTLWILCPFVTRFATEHNSFNAFLFTFNLVSESLHSSLEFNAENQYFYFLVLVMDFSTSILYLRLIDFKSESEGMRSLSCSLTAWHPQKCYIKKSPDVGVRLKSAKVDSLKCR